MRTWYFAAVGALSMLPFLAPRLSAAGLGDGGAAWTLAAIPLGTLLGGPLWGHLTDRVRAPRRLHQVAIGTTALLCVGFAWPLDTLALQLLLVAFAFTRAGVFPLADAATLHAVGPRYGAVRAVGSVGYIVGIGLLGVLRVPFPTSPFLLAAVLLAVATVWSGRLPELPDDLHVDRPPLRRLLADPTLRLLLAIAVLNGLSITAYDHLFALHMERSGVSAAWTSTAIAWGVAIEVLVMLAGDRLLRRFDARVLLLVAVAMGVPRFALTAWWVDPRAIALLQGLHGLQFGLFWITAVELVGRSAPPGLRRSVQALLPAAAFGIAPLTVLLLGGTWLQLGTTRGLFGSLVVPAGLATVLAAILVKAPRHRPPEEPAVVSLQHRGTRG
jgi:PPP family 3-phenylpropionic acid transporter